ncbi:MULTISPECIES: NADPH dehydrogenase NamA [Geobacillus]|uniref:NADPH dehydrogenase n=1 Tax=Geobacillus stearothermophilus TaxID=1422 RepID=A0A150NE89_GEOSE|nr:NADPH dehydrogenase NamA [Geobacillus stearothermophilus]KMY57217.1 NADPH dehydrogenase [Geobacillus stearothermophilus]KYD35017.1 NADPH dehydrogenase [Geobacillus stearothermophilus]MED3784744.1 NADPH dehydrogenase NamA [Geobacillus stearothermophilus]MED4870718.1 NADPH dehydrogenase NamA [Geobacillus stearothermophilus]MED4980368.1 NADPH dehydrogenase NamA [Geobacillus stearothermophilus]
MNTVLFSPYTIRGLTLKNRIVMSPMCMYSCDTKDGAVRTWHKIHYPARAVGQVGLIIVEATGVTPQGRISERDLGIWSDDHIAALRELVGLVKEHGAAIGIQLAHAGRKSQVPGEIIAPSAVPFDDSSPTPKEMTKADIEETVQAFQNGARRAKEAGFDVIEIHAAHGYLINEFLSPLSNRRQDEYGGSPENRYRFLGEVIDAVREVWDGPLFVRISASDYHPDGLTAKDYVPYAKRMKEQGVDLVDVSSGAIVPARMNVYPGYQVPFAELIRREADIPTGAVGLITSGWQAEEILQNGRADLVFLGRELLRNPYWPYAAARELGAKISAPVQYERGWRF